MILKVYGSGSSGNCYLLGNESEALVIEAGVRSSSVLLDTDYRKISGVIVSHRHGDHFGYAGEWLDRKINVWVSDKQDKERPFEGNKFSNLKTFRCGGFDVLPFELRHDTPCFGFLIKHQKMDGKLLYCTDTYDVCNPEGVRYEFMGITTAMIEADFDSDMLNANLNKGVLPTFLGKRIYLSHLDIKRTVCALKTINSVYLRNVLLIHLSKNNADEEIFKKRASSAIGKPVEIARPGTIIELDKPF